MNKWIQSISGNIPHTNKTVDIALDGKNLIVTGANGSGKTSFLKAAYEKVDLLVAKKQGVALLNAKNDLVYCQNRVKELRKEGNRNRIAQTNTLERQINLVEEIGQYNNYMIRIQSLESQVKTIEYGFQVVISDITNVSSLYDDRKAVIRFFEENHFSEITSATTPKGLSLEEDDAKKQNPEYNFGKDLEQHLVNLITHQSLAITKDKNPALAGKIEKWFVDFEKNLKLLFEDETLTLNFDSDTLKFTICQKNKPPYTFQTLSAGYRAIFDIYAELIMRTEYFKLAPSELTGVVFIDEIDSHLHVSLQRLILPFFASSFPQIQFIVTTHSPFVIMSTPDTIIFDLAKNEPITDDLSFYTYSAVMKGLWNIKPISVNVEATIKEISEIVNADKKNYSRLAELVQKIHGHEDALDNESKYLFLLGLEALQENTENV
jgi:AAA15 family ATPase/GTPase